MLVEHIPTFQMLAWWLCRACAGLVLTLLSQRWPVFVAWLGTTNQGAALFNSWTKFLGYRQNCFYPFKFQTQIWFSGKSYTPTILKCFSNSSPNLIYISRWSRWSIKLMCVCERSVSDGFDLFVVPKSRKIQNQFLFFNKISVCRFDIFFFPGQAIWISKSC